MKKSIHILFVLCIGVSVYAQNLSDRVLLSNKGYIHIEESDRFHYDADFSKVDAFVSRINADQFYSHKDLSQYLAENSLTERDKVRSIFTWIATNISYDQQFINQKQSRTTQLADIVWNSRIAVCEGYANLFNEMCKISGIESRMVKGYVREFMDNELQIPNHAWNSVKINGKWHLLDVTWASLNFESIKSDRAGQQVIKRRNRLDYYFLVDPQEMILTHLPEDPYWQLQNNTVEFETFISGESAILNQLSNKLGTKPLNFEMLISNHEKLDSLDRAIAYLERMVCNSYDAKAYGLGIGYYYKAQEILEKTNQEDPALFKKLKNQAKSYYKLSLEYLSLLNEDDYGYDFSKDLADNVLFRMETLQ